MKKSIIGSLGFILTFGSSFSQAACPKLPAKDIAYYLCPVVGSYNVIPQTTVVYQRPLDVLGALSNMCSAISKSLRDDDKEYSGVESNVKEGTLVCHYDLPDEWKEAAHIKEFSLEGKITTPPSLQGAVCPVLNFKEISDALCQNEVRIGNGPWWKLKQQGVSAAACNIVKGLWNSIKSVAVKTPEGTIKGQIGEGTTSFTHTCTYSYHSRSTPKELTLNGEMSLELLKRANETIAKEIKD